MAIAMECLNVVIPKTVINAKYPGGLSQYQRDCPNQTFLQDEHLTRVGFMDPGDVESFIHQLESRGFRFLDADQKAVDIVVVDMLGGPTAPCEWIKFDSGKQGPRCWLRGTAPGKLSKPVRPSAIDPSGPGGPLDGGKSERVNSNFLSEKGAFMASANVTNVDAAFDILLEQIETEIDLVNRAGARAFEDRDYGAARATLERAGLFIAFRDRTAALRREWVTLAGPQVEAEETTEERTQRRDLGRLQRGLRTPEEAYYRPILQILVELGGRAPMGQVLDRVGQVMRGVLRDVDYQPLASDPDLPRWRNSAQWARNSMVQEGLPRNDSPRGIWEISDAGRQSLQG